MRRALLIAVFLTACSSPDASYFNEPDAGPAPDFSFETVPFEVRTEPSVVEVGLNETFRVSAAVYDRNGDPLDAPIEWSWDESILRAEGDRYRAVAVGTTALRARAGTVDGVVEVNVGAQRVGRIDLIGPETFLAVGETTEIEVTPYGPLGEMYQTPELLEIQFESSDPSVASIDSFGRIEALQAGSTEISIIAQLITERITIEVFEYAAEALSISYFHDTLVPGETSFFRWTVDWATRAPRDYDIVFESSDPDVVLMQDSQFFARTAGTATITATLPEYGVSGTMVLTVDDRYEDFALGSDRVNAIAQGDVWALTSNVDNRYNQVTNNRGRYTAIDVGFGHYCMLAVDGTVDCIGTSDFGQAGRTIPFQPSPFPVGSNGLAVEIRVDGNRSCYRVATQWWCWGDLGDGLPEPNPRQVNYEQFDTSASHQCEVENTRIACRGSNVEGQLGLGTRSQADAGFVVSQADFTAVEVGGLFTCALAGGTAYCWGDGDFGQLGSGTYDDRSTPGLVDTTESFSQLTSGAAHTCALASDGRVWCWGLNDSGQLGDSSFDSSPRPVLIDSNQRFVKLDSGADFTCGMTTASALYCWGGAFTGSPFPIRVPLRTRQFF